MEAFAVANVRLVSDELAVGVVERGGKSGGVVFSSRGRRR